jgi:hypothetical protein
LSVSPLLVAVRIRNSNASAAVLPAWTERNRCTNAGV